jgi:hypothetical protein
MERILDGDLGRFEVPDLLNFLNMARSTGVLVLERSERENKLFFGAGQLVFAVTNREDLRLGQLLVRSGKLQSMDLDRIVDEQPVRPLKLGERLLAKGLLAPDELETALKVQVSEVVFDSLEWREGRFTLYDRVKPPGTGVTLAIDLQNLIMEGVRRIDERARIADVFPTLDLIVEVVANPARIKSTVTFTPEEWRVFFLVDGRRTLEEICALVQAADRLETLAILHHLLAANFIAPAAASSATSADAKSSAAGAAAQPVAVDTQRIVSPRAVPCPQPVAPAPRGARLHVQAARGEQVHALSRSTMLLGRHRNNDVVLQDAKVSAFHARIDHAGDEYVLVDLDSRNGTFVRGQRVTQVALRSGDELRFGLTRAVFVVDDDAGVA